MPPVPIEQRMSRRSLLRVLSSTLLAYASFGQAAEGLGSGPITLIVPFGAGTGADQHARVLSREIGDILKVPVIVDNRPGANGAIGAQALKAAPADGKTWMIATNSTQVLSQILVRNPGYAPFADFVPVRGLTRGYQVMVVGAAAPIQDLAGFIALASSRPGKLTFGSGSAASQMGGELLKFRAGIDMLNVPYKSSAAAMTDLVGGRIDAMFVDLPLALPLLESGKIRAVAVSTAKRLSALPKVPTFEEAGVPGYRNAFWSGIYVRAGTPQPLVQRIGEVIRKANAAPAAQRYLETASIERLDLSAAEMLKLQVDDLTLARAVAAKTGITPE